jgi:myo-inositol catabolism protein IolC/predicted dehydrogenase
MTAGATTSVRVGVFGTSWWADAMYLPPLRNHPAAEVVAVCGRQPDTAARFAATWEIPQWFVDPIEMLDQVEMDAVIIATSNDSHFELAMAALDRGLHVLCEKPLALHADQAATMTARATATGAITLVPFTYHYMPVNRFVKRLIATGYVGKPLHVNLRYYTGFGFDNAYSWRFDRDVAGAGIIGDLGSHWIHLARWLLSDCETSVSAVSSTFVERGARPDNQQYEQLEDSAVMTVRYGSGAYGVLQVSAVCHEETPFGQTHHLEVHGDAGTIYATCDWDTVQEVRGVRAGETGGAKVLPIPDDIWNGVRRDTVPFTYRDVFRNTDAMTRGWITAIQSNRPIEPSFAEGLAVQRVVDAAVRSAANGGAPQEILCQRPIAFSASTTQTETADVCVFAIDHRWQMEEMFAAAGVDFNRIAPLKALLFQAFERVACADSRSSDCGVGILLDDQYGRELLQRATGRGLWVARAFDVPLSRPVEFMAANAPTAALSTWETDHIAKLMVYAHPEDPPEIAEIQWQRMQQLNTAALAARREFLIEFQSPSGQQTGPDYLPLLIAEAYRRGIAPTWWKLPPIDDAEQWSQAAAIIRACDPTCRGMLVLGQTAEPEVLLGALKSAASEPMVRGFAIGRAIFGQAVTGWLSGNLDDDEVVDAVANRFTETIAVWNLARQFADLARTIGGMVQLLEGVEEARWSSTLSKQQSRLVAGDALALTDFLRNYGGMGSLNDLVIDARNGLSVSADEEGRLDIELCRLRSLAWNQASAMDPHLRN